MEDQFRLSDRPSIRKNGGVYPWADLADWPPTFVDLHRYAVLIRYTDEALRDFINHWTDRGWVDEKGRPLRDANLLLRTHREELEKDGVWISRPTTTRSKP